MNRNVRRIGLGLLILTLLGGIGFMGWYLIQPLPSAPVQSVVTTTTTPTPTSVPSATLDVAAMVNALVQTALASITPLATPTAMPTATPPVVGDLCINRWTVSCPTNWVEVRAAWLQIAATYGIDFVLPETEPQRKLVSGSWTMTFYPNGKQVVVVTPAREAWVLGVHNVIKLGNFEFVIFVQCGNLAWRPIPPLVTPVPTATPTLPVIPTNPPVPPPCPPGGCAPTDPAPSTPVPPPCPPGGCAPTDPAP